MPKRNDINRILIIGSGPIVIGQACEFDYSGVQACTALKEEGYKIILINSNPATIMTDPEISDVTYIEPINWKIIEKIIIKEKPDALLPTMGGQTALNCTLDLEKNKILKKYNIEILGSSIKSIQKAENRRMFENSMKKIQLETAKSGIANNIKEAINILKKVKLPCIIRPSFTMGGSGGGIANNYKEFIEICEQGLQLSPNKELLIDESLIGWKEFEVEVLRDKNKNFIVICSIENLDPMGIHTGDSITVAPAQTLTDKEYQCMRNASKSILEEIGIISGGANVQFAINPKNGRMIVVEMNPRVSRSSALASKATGYPIAKIATKLSVGYTLDELKNEITNKKTPASFEPSIDYIVTKIPRFNFEKFPNCNDRLTTQMKSIGEVMGIGRNFQESIQKSICSLENGYTGFNSKIKKKNKNIKNVIKKITYELKIAGANRIWYIADAFRKKINIQIIHKLTHISIWFLEQIKELVEIEKKIKKKKLQEISLSFFKKIKKKGFSDLRISELLHISEKKIRERRYELNLYPTYKRIDTCSAEFSTKTAYMYSTWSAECESYPTKNNKKIIIIGSGPNRIGQGIEFDYCCVHASLELQKNNFETIIINSNPETVSTDYNISDRLYFEPITLETIIEIVRIEKPIGVIIQFGGQTPLKLAKKIESEGIQIMGTNANQIDQTENRDKFQKIISLLKLKQPKNDTVRTLEDAKNVIKSIGYPVIIRPSYVLGGRNMEIIYSEKMLTNYFNKKIINNTCNKIFIDEYLENATEIDVDAICDNKNVFIGGVMEHIEQAGIHSGDSSCSLPVHSISSNIVKKIKTQVKKISLKIGIIGLINIQFAIKEKKIYVLEVNPRASRTIPFVSKSIGISLSKISALVMCGKKINKKLINKKIIYKYFYVKEAVLPFNKFMNVIPILGPEMRSTGETMGIGKNFSEAFAKSILSLQANINKKKRILISVHNKDKINIIKLAKKIENLGFKIDATIGTSAILKKNNILHNLVFKNNFQKPNIENNMKNKKYGYIINTSYFSHKKNKNNPSISQNAIKYNIFLNTTLNAAHATIQSLNSNPIYTIRSLQEIHKKNNY
ncbi:carbamoyl-phosphate synthase large subunit [Buchnera aphidicola (Kurisakia onigurumii)]|uniref:carbamoyl-phosphate synthase large subunit n=1 Tax=Buchnera aphidicola TaxID=9 RepID=UPI0031B67C8E